MDIFLYGWIHKAVTASTSLLVNLPQKKYFLENTVLFYYKHSISIFLMIKGDFNYTINENIDRNHLDILLFSAKEFSFVLHINDLS